MVGLEGAWGSGKTWVIRQLKTLAEDETHRPVFIDFNPWMVSGTNDLVVALLGQLSRQLAEQGSKSASGGGRAAMSKAVKAIDRYASALVAIKHVSPALDMLIPGAGIVVGGIATAAESAANAARAVIPALPDQASKKSLVALRGAIEVALQTFGHKIVVVVDDLDRIAPADVAAIVQAVKAVADFPHVVYLLAYDADTLAQALRTSLRVGDGHAYLEKIIQVAVPLPELPARRVQPYAVAQLRSVLPVLGAVSEPEQRDLELGLPVAAALMQTPRDVLRLCTRLWLAAGQLSGKVNLADLAVVEAVALKVPEFLPWMKRHRLPHVMGGVEGHEPSLQQRRPAAGISVGALSSVRDRAADEKALDSELLALGILRGDARMVYQHAIDHLFALSKSKIYAGDKISNHLRLNRFRHWYRWQCFTDHQEPWEATQIQAMVSDAASAAPELTSIEAVVEFSAQVCDLKDSLVEPDSVAWAKQFIHWDVSDRAGRVREPDFGYGPFKALLVLLRDSNEKTRDAAWTDLISGSSLELGAMLLMRAEATTHEQHADLLTSETRLSLTGIWFGRLKAHLEALVDGNSKERSSALALLYWAKNLVPIADVKTAVLAALSNANCTLSEFFGEYWSGDAKKHHSDLQVPWEILPEAHVLALRINDQEPDFKQSHELVWQMIEQKSRESTPAIAPGAQSPSMTSSPID